MRAIALSLAALFICTAATAQPLTRGHFDNNPACTVVDAEPDTTDPIMVQIAHFARDACRLPLALDAAQAAALLGDRDTLATRDEDTLLTLARSANAVTLDGALYGPLERIGTSEFWGTRFRLVDLDHAMLMLRFSNQPQAEPAEWRGADAAPTPPIQSTLQGQVIRTTLQSDALGETRRLVIYLPPGHHAGGNYAAVFLADGGAVNYYAHIVEPLIAAHEIEPVVLVGAEAGQRGIVEDRSALGADIRAIDYTPDLTGDDGARFRRHMIFFTRELVDYAVRTYSVTTDPRRRAVEGKSAGATFAFWAGYLHPEVFRTAIVVSQAWKPIDDIHATRERARFLMTAGYYEAVFRQTTIRTAATLRAAGYEVELTQGPAGHASDQDQFALLRGLRLLAPAQH